MGIGLALSPVHNLWLTKLATSSSGTVEFFLPAFGSAIWIIGSLYFVLVEDNWPRNAAGKQVFDWHRIDWGGWQVTSALLVIVVTIGLSGITADSLSGKFAPLLMGLSLLSLYLAARKLGKDMFLPLAVGAAVASLGVFVSAVLQPGQVTGGLIFGNNYDIVVGYVLLGTAVFADKYRVIIVSVAVTAMLLTGSPEAFFALAVLGVTLIWRRDWNRKAIVASLTIIIVVFLYGIFVAPGLYGYATKVARGEPASPRAGATRNAISYRLETIETAMTHIKPLGDGYSVSQFREGIVHNVPLVIVQQLGWPGVVAAAAWVWICLWGTFRTRWKYAWILVATLSVWDHYTWTQIGPWVWALAGVSTAASNIKTDLIFQAQKQSIVLRSKTYRPETEVIK